MPNHYILTVLRVETTDTGPMGDASRVILAFDGTLKAKTKREIKAMLARGDVEIREDKKVLA